VSDPWASKLGFPSSELPKTILPPPKEVQVEEVVEEAFDRAQVEESARNSLDFLAALSMPSVFRFFFPKTYHAIWSLLLSHVHKLRDFPQIALGFPRGFAKTTFIKLFILYVILFTQRRFIAICAKKEEKAEAIISDVMDFLRESNIVKIFGDFQIGLEQDKAHQKKFGFRGRDIVIWGGTVFTIRGLNVKHQRPDVMIFDDIQDKKDAESELISNEIEANMYSTAMKAKSPLGCMFVFIANMYPVKWSLLRRIKGNPAWIKFIAGGILADGTSLWEDLQPIAQLLKEFQNDLHSGRPEVFYAEVLNDETASVNSLIDLSKVPEYPFDDAEICAGKFIIIDPSNDKANSDAVTVAYYEVHDAKPVCKEIQEGRMSPGKTIETALTICLQRNCNIVFIESNAYQYSLNYWFNFICAQKGIIGVFPIEIYSGSLSKNTRILNWFKQLMAGEFYLHPDTKAQTYSQVAGFNPLKTNNVDGILDCHTYAPKVLSDHGQFIASQGIIEMQESLAVKVLTVEQNSCF
jgi:hypothetical protein